LNNRQWRNKREHRWIKRRRRHSRAAGPSVVTTSRPVRQPVLINRLHWNPRKWEHLNPLGSLGVRRSIWGTQEFTWPKTGDPSLAPALSMYWPGDWSPIRLRWSAGFGARQLQFMGIAPRHFGFGYGHFRVSCSIEFGLVVSLILGLGLGRVLKQTGRSVSAGS
jgi:hypothetical protein